MYGQSDDFRNTASNDQSVNPGIRQCNSCITSWLWFILKQYELEESYGTYPCSARRRLGALKREAEGPRLAYGGRRNPRRAGSPAREEQAAAGGLEKEMAAGGGRRASRGRGEAGGGRHGSRGEEWRAARKQGAS